MFFLFLTVEEMVILQCSDDSATGMLHEMTEVMRYERLETAELPTVYEGRSKHDQTRKPSGAAIRVCLPPALPPRTTAPPPIYIYVDMYIYIHIYTYIYIYIYI